jgi:hypothetical protein
MPQSPSRRKSKRAIFQEFAREYLRDQQDHATPRDVVVWMINEKGYKEDPEDKIRRLTAEMSEAMRADTHVDPQGREVRSILAIPTEEPDENGKLVQKWLWACLEDCAPHEVELGVAEIYKQGGKVLQSGKDVQDSYNDNHLPRGQRPVQLNFLDFLPEQAEN